MSQLNPRQREAVHYIDGPCLVLAGAGSGKTSVITRKMAYLIEHCGYSARHIAAVTFTNKAAREMKARVSQLVKGKAAQGLTVSTFHNLGLNIIRREHKTLGFKPGFTIMDAEDARSILKDLVLQDGEGPNDLIEALQAQISAWKGALISPDTALSQATSSELQHQALVYGRYNKALQAYNAVDFDDLITLPAQLFAQHPAVLQRWQQRIRYLLVDEYQDTNSSQYQLVKYLMGDRGGLTVVGDDDQSIYAWRGARPENLSLLKKDFPHLHLIKLEQNYRSTARILKVANQVISHNPHEFEKTLWSDFGQGEPLRLLRCPTEDAEAERIAHEILSQRLRRKAEFRDFAVLYRGNHQSRILELKLQHFQIPYNMSGGTSFFAKTEIKDVMAYLRLLVNPQDDNAFLRIINTPRRHIGTSTLEALGRYATDRNTSLLQASLEVGVESHIQGKGLERIRRFAHWLEQVRHNCHHQPINVALQEMLADMDYESWLHQNASSPKVAEKRFANVGYLVESVFKTLEKSADEGDSQEDCLKNAIAKLLLLDLLDRQEEEDTTDRVQLMTLHASKGLEFPHVFMMGLEEDLLPHRNAIDTGTVEEERRLAYVGITRAKRTLTLTLAATRKQFGEKQDTTPSRFLDEMPQEDIEREGFGNSNAQQVEQRGRESLSSILRFLDD